MSDSTQGQAPAADAALLREALDALPFLCGFINRDERYVYVNRAYAELIERPVEDLVGRTLREVAGEQVYAEIRPNIEAALRGERVTFRVTVSMPGRPHHQLESRYVPRRGASGEVEGFFTLVRDITQEVDPSRDRLALLADASRAFDEAGSEGLSATLQRVVRLVSETFRDPCVMTLGREDGTDALDIVAAHHPDPEARKLLQESLSGEYRGEGWPRQAYRQGKVVLVTRIPDERLPTTPQSRLYLERYKLHGVIVVPLRAGGRVLGTLGMSRSRTEPVYNQADCELLQELADRAGLVIQNARLLKEAQDAVRIRDEFLSVASHELKTPLTSLRLQLELVGRSLNPESRAQAEPRLASAHRQLRRLAALVENLLDVSRIAMGRLSLELSEVDLIEVVREVVAQFEGQIETSGSALTLVVPGALVGQWDRGRLEQVVTNLISNAIKYGNGKPITVEVSARGETAELKVIDHGIGIPAEAIPRLFQRFERAVTDRHYGGLGLGLFITREIVTAMRGSIRVDSHPGNGAVVTVELPVQPPPASP